MNSTRPRGREARGCLDVTKLPPIPTNSVTTAAPVAKRSVFPAVPATEIPRRLAVAEENSWVHELPNPANPDGAADR